MSALLSSMPAVVLVQEARLPHTQIAHARRVLHASFPAYSLFVNRHKRRHNRERLVTQVVSLVHVRLAARSSLLDIRMQLSAYQEHAPDAQDRLHFVHMQDPDATIRILIGNVYMPQAADLSSQSAVQALINDVVLRWESGADFVVIGGDMNASIMPRAGYVETSRTRAADQQFHRWIQAGAWLCRSPGLPTWTSSDQKRRAVLDCFLTKQKHATNPCFSNPVTLCPFDPRHDHVAVQIKLFDERVGPMPSLEAMRRPRRLRLNRFQGEVKLTWQRQVREALVDIPQVDSDAGPSSAFLRLEAMQQTAIRTAEALLGVTGGAVRPQIRLHSEQIRRLLARLRLLKVIRRELHDRKQSGLAQEPSRAMRKAWDAGLFPSPGAFGCLHSLWSSAATRAWAEAAVDLVRTKTQACLEEMQRLRRTELDSESERRRQAAIDNFWQRGGLRRLLRPADPALHSYALRSCAPDTVVVTADSSVLEELDVELLHIGSLHRGEGRLTISTADPPALHRVLERIADRPCQVEIQQSGRVVTASVEKMPSWEASLGAAGGASKQVCDRCRGGGLVYVPGRRAGSDGRFRWWCTRCRLFTEPTICKDHYALLPFDTEGLQRIPSGSGESLSAPVEREDLEHFLATLPNGKAAVGMPYELLKCSPDTLKEAVLTCINMILTGEASVPSTWLGGLVRFLHKGGDPLEARNYRPVCLQDTGYKILAAIVNDRLGRLCERYGLLDPSQEGFRRLRSTQRQIQSLHWAVEDAAARRELVYIIYIDFENAFNSPDHEALWRWLEELNVPDVDLLRALYTGAYYSADLPYGRSPPVFLTRGTKQGDILSPLLFNLLFNALLHALRNSGVGVRTVSGLRTPCGGMRTILPW